MVGVGLRNFYVEVGGGRGVGRGECCVEPGVFVCVKSGEDHG